MTDIDLPVLNRIPAPTTDRQSFGTSRSRVGESGCWALIYDQHHQISLSYEAYDNESEQPIE